MKKIIPIFLALIISVTTFFNCSVSSYAVESWSKDDIRKYYFHNLGSFLVQTAGVIFGGNDLNELSESILQLGTQKAIERNMSFDEWLVNELGFTYRNDVEDEKHVDTVTVEPELSNIMVQVANNFIVEHPLSYSIQNIYSYKNVSATDFTNNDNYLKYCEIVEGINTSNFVFYVNDWTTNVIYNGSKYVKTVDCAVFWYDGEIDFYMSNGHVNSYSYYSSFVPTHNWSYIQPTYKGSYSQQYLNSGWHVKYVLEGNIYEYEPTSYVLPSIYRNTNFNINYGNTSIFNVTQRNMPIYAYDSIDSIKIHDKGQPATYYVTENYKGSNYTYENSVTMTQSEVVNNNDLYEQTINNITNNYYDGISAEELMILIQTLINDNNDKPVPTPTPTPPSDDGGGGSGSDDKDSLWDKIKDTVGRFFESIAEVIEGLVELIVNTVLTVLTDLIDGFNNILKTMVDFFLGTEDADGVRHNSFIDLMSGLFDWLPEPLPLMIKSIFTLACVFALIKMIKGLAS